MCLRPPSRWVLLEEPAGENWSSNQVEAHRPLLVMLLVLPASSSLLPPVSPLFCLPFFFPPVLGSGVRVSPSPRLVSHLHFTEIKINHINMFKYVYYYNISTEGSSSYNLHYIVSFIPPRALVLEDRMLGPVSGILVMIFEVMEGPNMKTGPKALRIYWG